MERILADNKREEIRLKNKQKIDELIKSEIEAAKRPKEIAFEYLTGIQDVSQILDVDTSEPIEENMNFDGSTKSSHIMSPLDRTNFLHSKTVKMEPASPMLKKDE